jgi:hypothetical protein
MRQAIYTLAEKILAWMSKDYLNERVERGSREKFEAALAQVADVAPIEGDEL